MTEKCLASPNHPQRHWWVISQGHGGGITLVCAWCRKRTSYRSNIPLADNRRCYDGQPRVETK